MAPWGHMYVNPGLTEPNLIIFVSNNCIGAGAGFDSGAFSFLAAYRY